jgi:hypothetical protein
VNVHTAIGAVPLAGVIAGSPARTADPVASSRLIRVGVVAGRSMTQQSILVGDLH